MTKELTAAAIIILTLISLICIVVCISSKKRIEKLVPYQLGNVYREGNKDFIFVAFDAKLTPLDSSSSESIVLFDVIERFWSDPAKELNKFYEEGNAFGLSLQICDVTKLPSGKFALVVQDNKCKKYILNTKFVPQTFEVDIQQTTGK